MARRFLPRWLLVTSRIVLTWLAIPALPSGAGEAAASPDLSRLSPEELLQLDVVSAASGYRQARREAPSTITVVTSEEIARHGYRSLADVLANVPGFYVSYDRNYSYLGVRGFSRPGDYNSRVLVLLDRVRVNENLYDGVYPAQGLPVDLALVDRIEIVRGPAASVYGNSAFFAVIDIVTKRGDAVGRGLAASASSLEGRTLSATCGRSLPNGMEVAAAASMLDSQGGDLYFPEYDDGQGGGIARGLDGEAVRTLYASAAHKGVRAFASYGHRRKDVPTGAWDTAFGVPGTRTTDVLTLAGVSYEARPSPTVGLATRLYHGRYDYEGAYVEEDRRTYHDFAHGTWWGAEADFTADLGKSHVVTGGIELQLNTRQDQGAYYADAADPDVDARFRSHRFGFHVQDELRPAASLLLTAGLRYDRYQTFGGELSPRLAAIWTPTARTSVKALYGHAFRAPNEYELRYYPSRHPLRPESIHGVEVVGERVVAKGLVLSASAFSNDVDGLVSLVGSGPDFQMDNVESTLSRGVELGLEGERAGWRGRAAYSFQASHLDGGTEDLTNSPHHLAKLSLARGLVHDRVTAALNVQHVSSRRTLQGAAAPAFTTANATVSARLVRGLRLAASVYNLTDSRRVDPGSEEHRQDVIPQDGRFLRVELSYRF
jgi:outer membrane cobalamin receptor